MLSLLSGHWLVLTLITVFLYGIAEGLCKQFIGDITPPRFCLYSVPIAAVVYLGFYLMHDHPPPLDPEGRQFLFFAVLASLMESTSAVLYFEALSGGPVSIVGPITAAAPVVTVVSARFILDEILTPAQYAGIVLVIAACIGIAHAHSDPERSGESGSGKRGTSRLWFLQSVLAMCGWGMGATLTKYAYQLPRANEANFMLYWGFAVAITLGGYGVLREREWKFPAREIALAAAPLVMFSTGSLLLILAYKWGPASLVTTLLAGSIPIMLVYAFFIIGERLTRIQWLCITLVFIGMILCSGPE
ncbi:MAG: DMT family transporter [Acidobacteriota bacterium]|nr:MAG: DMT family transporter [Acidobacteriota bacterium]